MTNGCSLQQFYPQITNSPSGEPQPPNFVFKRFMRVAPNVTLTVFCSLLTWNQQISLPVSAFFKSPKHSRCVKSCLCFNLKNIPGIIGAEAFNRSSMDPCMEFWRAQEDWGTWCKPRIPESEYSWAVRWAWPGFLMMEKPQRRSICCQRWRCSRRHAVISDKAFLWKTPRTFNILQNTVWNLGRIRSTHFASRILLSTWFKEELCATWRAPRTELLFFFILSPCEGNQGKYEH